MALRFAEVQFVATFPKTRFGGSWLASVFQVEDAC